jgi:transcriptional regulator
VTGHVARANPLWREADGQPVLLMFQGPQAYVSPNWYPSKAQHGKAVPTWNYAMVQVHGTLRAIEDPQWLRAFVTRLTERHEDGRRCPGTWPTRRPTTSTRCSRPSSASRSR